MTKPSQPSKTAASLLSAGSFTPSPLAIAMPNTMHLLSKAPSEVAAQGVLKGSRRSVPVRTLDAFHGKWKRHITAATKRWSLLSESELLHAAGVESALVELVLQRYGVSTRDAMQQVKLFIAECNA